MVACGLMDMLQPEHIGDQIAALYALKARGWTSLHFAAKVGNLQGIKDGLKRDRSGLNTSTLVGENVYLFVLFVFFFYCSPLFRFLHRLSDDDPR
jgi:hypothetical protein